MKIDISRESPKIQPVNRVVIELTPEEARLLRGRLGYMKFQGDIVSLLYEGLREI